MIGKKADDLEERCGYYGEKIVLWAQTAGLKTGWVETGYTTKPEALEIGEDEELVLSFAIGYSEESGKAHKVKSVEDLSTVTGEMPDWFQRGVEYTILAPSAGNQQLYNIHLDGDRLSVTMRQGLLEKVDIGIAKVHFEIASGIEHSRWS